MIDHHTPPTVVRPHVPTLWADGKHDDAPALQAYFDGAPVEIRPKAQEFVRENGSLSGGVYRIKGAVCISRSGYTIKFAEFINGGRGALIFAGDHATVTYNYMKGVGVGLGDCPAKPLRTGPLQPD